MKLVTIDPGNIQSAVLEWNDGKIGEKFIRENEYVYKWLRNYFSTNVKKTILVYEKIASYGMAVGQTVFDTCEVCGDFRTIWGHDWDFVYRKNVKMHLCYSMRAKDSNIRQAIIDKYPADGGGKCPQVGVKSNPGSLYGISEDLWSALAIAITYEETKNDS